MEKKQLETIIKNIEVAEECTEFLRTSLGPRGLDKMIINKRKQTIVTNDGATIMKQTKEKDPIWEILQTLSESQDQNCGDGTTSVVVLCAELLTAAKHLLEMGVHSAKICDALHEASIICTQVAQNMSINIKQGEKKILIENARTALSTKAVAYLSDKIAEMTVEAIENITCTNNNKMDINMKKLNIIKKPGKTTDETKIYLNSYILDAKINKAEKIKKEKQGTTFTFNVCPGQFSISNPKLNMDFSVLIKTPQAMQNLIEEEVRYVLDICNHVKNSGCNLLVLQKSIVHETVSPIAQKIFSDNGISIIPDLDREDFTKLCLALQIDPISDVLGISKKKNVGKIQLTEIEVGNNEFLLEIKKEEMKNFCSIVLRAMNNVILDEVERSINDALQVVRSLKLSGGFLPGGGALEIEMCLALEKHQKKNPCFLPISRAIKSIPIYLFKNAGLNASEMVEKIITKHKEAKNSFFGINLRKEILCDMLTEKIVHPTCVYTTMIKLAFECSSNILKIDDVFEIN